MNTEMTIKKLPVSMLKPAKYNPRKDLKPGDPAYEKIKRSLHDFGYVDPVIWNEVTGNIVGGHQRFKVLTAEGATEIDCVVVHIEDPQDEKALNIALNKAVGEWEPKALADLLSDLQLSGYDVGATGFDAAEIDDKHAFDCPVTGGQKGAQEGTLTLIAGISEKDAAPVRALLDAFSSQIYWFEQPGAGQLAKLCNQVSLAASLAGAAELIALAEQAGISPKLVSQMVGAGMGGSAQLSRVMPAALEGDYKPGFLAEHLRKDLRLALEAADDLQLTLPATETSLNLVDMLCQVGGERLGTQAVALLYADEATGVAAGLDWGKLDTSGPAEVPDEQSPARQRYFTNPRNL